MQRVQRLGVCVGAWRGLPCIWHGLPCCLFAAVCPGALGAGVSTGGVYSRRPAPPVGDRPPSAGAKAGLGEAMERYLATMNLPSRADITVIGERLQSIEAQLNRLTEIVSSMASVEAAPPSIAPKPKRTRKPPPRGDSGGRS